VFNPPPAADPARKPSAYAKLEQTNDDLARELDAAKAHIAELEAAQPDQGSLSGIRRRRCTGWRDDGNLASRALRSGQCELVCSVEFGFQKG